MKRRKSSYSSGYFLAENFMPSELWLEHNFLCSENPCIVRLFFTVSKYIAEKIVSGKNSEEILT